MDSFLVLLASNNGQVPPADLDLCRGVATLAAATGAVWRIGLLAADSVLPAGLDTLGAASIEAVEDAQMASARYATDLHATAAIAQAVQPGFILAADSTRWSRVLPGLTRRLGGRFDAHLTALQAAGDNLAATRWFYRQRLEADFTRATRPWAMTLSPGALPMGQAPAATAPSTLHRLEIAFPDHLLRARVEPPFAAQAGEQTIRPEADLLLVAGAGWTKKQADGQIKGVEAETLLRQLLRQTGASLGSTKSLVDIGAEGSTALSFLTHMHQVGQTGSTPRHRLGLATCCHGEEPHVVGWRFINERRAINLDGNCGWANGKADVLYVADAFAVLRRLNELLAAEKPSPA